MWFSTFEFNGSFYLLARAIGYKITGYNTIAFIGKITPIVVLVIIISLAIFKKDNRFETLLFIMLLSLSCYLFTSSTVHPWYIAMLLILGVLSNYRFPILWSFTVILSYSAYSNKPLIDNYWFIIIEYSVVFLLFVNEVFINNKSSNLLED